MVQVADEPAGATTTQDLDEDARLMLAVRDGDDAAFATLHRRHAARLLRHLEHMVRDAAVAEELLQDAFLRVHRARARWTPQARVTTWLWTIATNLALNELRRPRRRHPHRSTDASDVDRAPLELDALAARADDIAHARHVGTSLQNALAALPARQRDALLLAAVDGLSYAEVAASLGTSEKSVKALVHRARVALIERMPAGTMDGEEPQR